MEHRRNIPNQEQVGSDSMPIPAPVHEMPPGPSGANDNTSDDEESRHEVVAHHFGTISFIFQTISFGAQPPPPLDSDEEEEIGMMTRRALIDMDFERQQSRGISLDDLETIAPASAMTTRETTETVECCICLEGLEVGEMTRTLPCRHAMHRDCVDEWLEEQIRCPICRAHVQPATENTE